MCKMFLAFFLSLSLLLNIQASAQEHHHGVKTDVPAQTITKIMQGMNEDLANLSKAIMQEDYSSITSSAHKIANHPAIIKEDMKNLFQRLGDKKQAFIACDSAVHDFAVKIAKAGKTQDMQLILANHSAMVAKATECHKKFRRPQN